MSNQTQAAINSDFQKEVRAIIVSSLHDLNENPENLTKMKIPGIADVKDAVNALEKKLRLIEKNVEKLCGNGIPKIIKTQDIAEIVRHSRKGFKALSVLKLLDDLGSPSGAHRNLQSVHESALDTLFIEIKRLVKNLEDTVSKYSTQFAQSMLHDVDSGIINVIEVFRNLDPCIKGSFGIHVPQSHNIGSLANNLKQVNDQLESIDIKELDENVQKVWKPIKIDLVFALGLIQDVLNLMGNIAPLNVSLGASGGVAAGVDIEAKASASVVSIGKLTWGSIATVIGMLVKVINNCDAHIDFSIAQRKAS